MAFEIADLVRTHAQYDNIDERCLDNILERASTWHTYDDEMSASGLAKRAKDVREGCVRNACL